MVLNMSGIYVYKNHVCLQKPGYWDPDKCLESLITVVKNTRTHCQLEIKKTALVCSAFRSHDYL